MEIKNDIIFTISVATVLALLSGLALLFFIALAVDYTDLTYSQGFSREKGKIIMITIPVILMWLLDSKLISQLKMRRIFTTTLLIFGAIITIYTGWQIVRVLSNIAVYIIPFLYGASVILSGHLFVKQMKAKTVVPFFLNNP